MSYVVRFPMNGKRYVPIIRVSFHTETKCYQTSGKFVGLGGTPDPTDQVLSVTTQKTLKNPAGAFTIQLVGDEWLWRLKSNDLVVIRMGYKAENGKEELDTVMVGLIDTVRRFRTIGENNPTVTTTITGRDFGKVLIKSMLRFYPELGWNKEKEQKFFLTETGWITLMKAFTNENAIKGSPAKVLDTIMRYILQQIVDVQWTVYDESGAEPIPKKVELAHILRYNFAQVDLFLPLFMTAQQYEGSIWNLMERASIKPFTELFVDTRDGLEAWNPGTAPRVVNETIEESSSPSKAGKPKAEGGYVSPRFSFGSDNAAVMVALRNTPFDKSAWEKLKTHDLPAEDVISEDLSFSDDEHYNLFWAGTTITPFSTLDLKREAPPLINEENVKRYGLSPLEVTIEGMEMLKEKESEQKVKLVGLSQAYSAKLKAWFEHNHEYLSGTMEVRGKGSYRIGQRLLRKGINREFYIEGVSQSFQVFTGWTTQLALTRGMEIGKAPDHTVYLPKPVVPKPPAVPASKATPAQIEEEYYVVKKGDTLWSIAGMSKFYGDPTKWTKIWEANKEMLIKRDPRNSKDPGHWIYPGQKLRIPKK